jgi:predicted DsbA family dithiol-disulfide isomerase
MAITFSVNWDYRCPFARNVHEYLVTALEASEGTPPWDVQFRGFSLDQTHVEDGAPPVWDEPDRYPALLANEVGIVVRDRIPERFLELHRAMFAARHDRALDTRKREVIDTVLDEVGLDVAAVWAEIEDGWPLDALRQEHTAATDLDTFGVPTFIIGNKATFVRLLDRPGGDGAKATATVNRIVDLLTGWPELNEFKYTQLPN